jgi:hypothetical protein
LICDEPMPSCEGEYIFKYFLVRTQRRSRTRARSVPESRSAKLSVAS